MSIKKYTSGQQAEGPTGGAFLTDELALGHVREAYALQVEGATALALTQQQLAGLLTHLDRRTRGQRS